MNEPVAHTASKAVDSIQQYITQYACNLTYDDISPAAMLAAKARIIDSFGALIGGYFGESCHIVRKLAAQMPNPDGSTIIGTRMKTAPDLAAFVNATTQRYVEMTDSYHWPGSAHGHPSDVITPVLAAAEHAQASGREFLTGVILAYEVFLRISDVFHNSAAFDQTNFGCIGTAVGAGKVLNLTPAQLSHCLSMAVVCNNTLRQVRKDHQSMFKVAAAGQAGRAGVFAALLARAGMEGPHLPFEGKAGWCDHIARERITLNAMGGKGVPFRILVTQIKNRSADGNTLSSILAAEKVAPLKNIKDVRQVTVEVHDYAKDGMASGSAPWNPESRETADHSIPYVVAATLMDGTVSPRSFNDAHLWSPALRDLMQKIEVVECKEFTAAYHRQPQEHRARVTVLSASGERLVGLTGGDRDDLSTPKSDAQIVEKFRGLTEDILGAKRVNTILDRLWHIEDFENAADIPSLFILS